MGIFDNFPYTNFHELNLEWILNMLQQIDKTMSEFVAINALKYADPIQWSIIRQYEKNTIVIDPLSGTAYISVQPVPAGVIITNTDYWSVVFDLGAFVVRASKNFAAKYEDATTLTATFPSSVNDWLIWGDVLYKVISPIVAGDQYVVDSNIKHFTMEDLVGHLEDLTTTDKSNVVAAINEVLQKLITTAGDLEDLNTTDKSNLVAAINEVLLTLTQTATDLSDKIDTLNYINVDSFGAVGDGLTDDSAAINAALAASNFITFTAGKTYLINSSLYLRRDQIVDLNGCTIKQGTPTITFTNDPNDHDARDSIARTTVMNGNIFGADSHVYGDDSKGIYVAAFYCNFVRLYFRNLDYGIHNRERFVYPNQNLNNNLYSDLRFVDCQKYSLLSEKDGDGQLTNIWAGSSGEDVGEYAIAIMRGAGWLVSNIHTYVRAKTQLYMIGCSNADITNCYFEGHTTQRVVEVAAHGKCNISNCNIMASEDMTSFGSPAALYLHKSGDSDIRAVFNVNNITFGYGGEFQESYTHTIELIRSGNQQDVYINASNLFVNIPDGNPIYGGGTKTAEVWIERTRSTGGNTMTHNGQICAGRMSEIHSMNSDTLTFDVPHGVVASSRPRAVVKVYIGGGISYGQTQGWAEITLYFKYDGTYQMTVGKQDFDNDSIITSATCTLTDTTVTIVLNRSIYGIAAIDKFIY